MMNTSLTWLNQNLIKNNEKKNMDSKDLIRPSGFQPSLNH